MTYLEKEVDVIVIFREKKIGQANNGIIASAVGKGVSKGPIGHGTNGSVHEVLQHDVFGILFADTAYFQQTKTGMQ